MALLIPALGACAGGRMTSGERRLAEGLEQSKRRQIPILDGCDFLKAKVAAPARRQCQISTRRFNSAAETRRRPTMLSGVTETVF